MPSSLRWPATTVGSRRIRSAITRSMSVPSSASSSPVHGPTHTGRVPPPRGGALIFPPLAAEGLFPSRPGRAPPGPPPPPRGGRTLLPPRGGGGFLPGPPLPHVRAPLRRQLRPPPAGGQLGPPLGVPVGPATIRAPTSDRLPA